MKNRNPNFLLGSGIQERTAGRGKEGCGRYSRCIAEKGSALQCISMGRHRKGKKSAEAAVSLEGSISGLGGESEEQAVEARPAGRGEPPCPQPAAGRANWRARGSCARCSVHTIPAWLVKGGQKQGMAGSL